MEGQSITCSSGRTECPDVRLLHYNDVYHIEPGSREPVGGIARFQTLCNYYRHDETFRNQPGLLTLFSGDAFNPSLESSVTKGSHMVPALNHIGTDVACVGNHDLDFGVPKFQELASQCSFPWLLANVIDPALGPETPLGNAKKTLLLSASNGIKVGIIGLVEREWLDTINSLPPNLQYRSASATAAKLAPQLRAQGADMVIALTHQREPNDIKLASKTPPGMLDLILGGHDHFYGHSIVNGTHILRSGTDFQNLSYIQAWRSRSPSTTDSSGQQAFKWDFTITRRDVVRSIPSEGAAAALVAKLSSKLRTRLEKPIGYTAAPLDARFTTVRLRESNLGNFVCDIMRLYYGADCALMAAGTIRGDQIYPPGVLKLKDIMNCFPFEDPVVVLRVKGKALRSALENSVATYPALEGRFPQVSNIRMTFDAKLPSGQRITAVTVGEHPLDDSKAYVLATRDYMARGKDGFDSLLYRENGGEAETLVNEESGMLISMLLRQYFTSMRVVDRLRPGLDAGATADDPDHLAQHWAKVHTELHDCHPVKPGSAPPTPAASTSVAAKTASVDHADDSDDDDDGSVSGHDEHELHKQSFAEERKLYLARHVLKHWRRVVGIRRHPELAHAEMEETPQAMGWTRGVAPRVEGRITIVNEHIQEQK